MEDCMNLDAPHCDDGAECYVLLRKDQKPICRTQCHCLPMKVPSIWNLADIVRQTTESLNGLPHFFLLPAAENSQQQNEWRLFLNYLHKYKRVAITKFESVICYILPPPKSSSNHAIVLYKTEKISNVVIDNQGDGHPCACPLEKNNNQADPCYVKNHGLSSEVLLDKNNIQADSTSVRAGGQSCDVPLAQSNFQTDFNYRRTSSLIPLQKNYVRTDPSYLKTLGQAHSSWIFGAIAELVDNSRDAKAATLKISIDLVHSKNSGKDIPMLSIIDDGHGMTHLEIMRMITFGHKQPDADDPDRIGKFGVGFKTGAMRLGKDALVLTQTANSRSIAFLSQSLNEGKDNLEIPIVSYHRMGQFMEVDTSVQSEALAKYNLKAIKDFSPFNKYLIGEKAGLFQKKGTGTQIYIWNLDEWGSKYSLEWDAGMSGASSFHQGDICICSKRIRSRPGQMSRTVPLDHSLRSYLELIFLDPRMKIYVQGSLVKSRPLAKSLNNTLIENGVIMGKPVQLILGRCQLELEQANCGIFLYWHGRLIEAYKRVGGMVHNGDKSHGIIGVIDVTDLMNDGNGRVWVHSNKQGFQDCEVYAQLEDWLGKRVDEYLDNNVDKLQLRRGSGLYKPDHEWVQCDKCRKWRQLSAGFDIRRLPQEWFCYMKPFSGKCDMPEQKVGRGVITISAKRSGIENHAESQDRVRSQATSTSEGSSDDDSSQTVEEDARLPTLKRLRRGPLRICKKS